MSIDLPDPNSIPRIRREDVDIQAIVAEIVGDDEPDEHEWLWQSYAGVEYDLYSTTDLLTWQFDRTVTGDGSIQSIVQPRLAPAGVGTANSVQKQYKILQRFNGKEPLRLQAIAAWDGSHVLLEWNSVGMESPQPNLRFHVLKNGIEIAVLPLTVTSYRDNAVGSRQKHIYSLPIYAG